MAYQKLQVGRALAVIPSDNANIPFPSVVATGSSTSVVASQLVDSTASFITKNVQVGDIIYLNAGTAAATVAGILSATTLLLNANIFTAAAVAYTIYSGSNNDGCVLYVGGAGAVAVTTTGNDTVTVSGVSAGQFLPIQVDKVAATGTTATLILALW